MRLRRETGYPARPISAMGGPTGRPALAFCAGLLATGSERPMVEAQTLDELRRNFVDPPDASRPMLRWWWFGPTIESAELDRQLQAMADAGLGGVEVAYVYPLAPATCDFGSDRFHELLRHAAERCRALGLRFDLTLGSGWSFGGPHITPDLAARRLHWEMREIAPGATGWPVEELIAAYLYHGSIHDRAENAAMLPVGDGLISVPDGSGPRTLL